MAPCSSNEGKARRRASVEASDDIRLIFGEEERVLLCLTKQKREEWRGRKGRGEGRSDDPLFRCRGWSLKERRRRRGGRKKGRSRNPRLSFSWVVLSSDSSFAVFGTYLGEIAVDLPRDLSREDQKRTRRS